MSKEAQEAVFLCLPCGDPCVLVFDMLVSHFPHELAKVISGGQLEPANLTFAAEAMGQCKDDDLVRNTLIPLLRHDEAIVREGAIYGLENHKNSDVSAVLSWMAQNDPSPCIRDLATE